MKNITFLILTILHANFCNAQTANPVYLFSSEIEAKLKIDTISKNYQHYAVNYAIIGDYKNTLFTEELGVLKYKKLKKGKVTIDTSFFNYKPVNALNEINKISENHQIIIINEAHYSAQNRVFTTQLLKKLYSKGYKTIFLEGLHPDRNKNLNKRKHALLTSGYYFNEPQYGNLVRVAIKKGYTVLPYEHDQDENEKDPLKLWYSREEGQADNILAFLKENPKEKIIIHCGYGHISEKIFEGEIVGNMAAIIKKKSGINPLTINQEDWLETFSEKTANPYRVIIDKNPPKEISVFKNSKEQYFSQKPINQDINVYFPSTKYIFGRPDWLFKSTDKRLVTLPYSKINLEYPYLVFAYYENEDEAIAIPSDIIEIKNKNDKKGLALEKGKYKLILKNINGKFQKLSLKVN